MDWKRKLNCYLHALRRAANKKLLRNKQEKNYLLLNTVELLIVPIDGQRNGLKTQAQPLTLLTQQPWSGWTVFALEPCKLTWNIFQDFLWAYYKQERQCRRNYWLLRYLSTFLLNLGDESCVTMLEKIVQSCFHQQWNKLSLCVI